MDQMLPVPTFAQVLDQLLTARGLSQARLARDLGVYESNIGRWRKGSGIDIVNVRKIADYFGVDRGWLEASAGYANTPARADHDLLDDPHLGALLDLELASLRDDLRGLPPVFWPTLLTALRQSRRLAVAHVRAAITLAQQPLIAA